MEDSPVLGLLKDQKAVKLETKEDKDNGRKVVPSETLIKKAIRKRAPYIRANSEYVTDSFIIYHSDLFMTRTLHSYATFIHMD